MRRRDLLAGLGGAAVVGAGGFVALSGSDGRTVDPVDVDLFDTPESQGGVLGVPIAGHTTVIDLFSTTCPPCKPAIDRLITAKPEADDVQFVSVTTEYLDGEQPGSDGNKTRADVIDWWATHGGPWPVGHDKSGLLFNRLQATAIPKTVVVDPGGTIVWSHSGVPDPDRVGDAIDEARA